LSNVLCTDISSLCGGNVFSVITEVPLHPRWTAVVTFVFRPSYKLVFKLSPCCCNERLSSGYFPGVCVLKADVSEHCVGSIFHLHHLLKMEPTQCSETSAYNTQTPGKYPEDNLSLQQHGETLKTRMLQLICSRRYVGRIYFSLYTEPN
jgi:hypothetical protein